MIKYTIPKNRHVETYPEYGVNTRYSVNMDLSDPADSRKWITVSFSNSIYDNNARQSSTYIEYYVKEGGTPESVLTQVDHDYTSKERIQNHLLPVYRRTLSIYDGLSPEQRDEAITSVHKQNTWLSKELIHGITRKLDSLGSTEIIPKDEDVPEPIETVGAIGVWNALSMHLNPMHLFHKPLLKALFDSKDPAYDAVADPDDPPSFDGLIRHYVLGLQTVPGALPELAEAYWPHRCNNSEVIQ